MVPSYSEEWSLSATRENRWSDVVSWPDDVAEVYRRQGVWTDDTLGDAFAKSVAENKDRVAVVDGDRRWTYLDLARRADRFAQELVRREICDGERVVFQLPNVAEFVACYFGCLKVGAVPVACLPHHRHYEIEALAKGADAAAWILPSKVGDFDYVKLCEDLRPSLPRLREVFVAGDHVGPGMSSLTDVLERPADVDARALDSHRPSPSTPAVFQLSGGTTGVPKLIPRTHNDYLYNSLASARAASLDRDSILLVSIPIAHNFPLACPGLQGALLLGGCVVLAASPAAEITFPLIERERVTWIPAVPATLIRWTAHPLREKHDLRSVRQIYVGGQRLSVEAARAAVAAFGPVVRQVYGMAEGLLCYTREADPAEVHLETQGRPISSLDEVRVVGTDGKPVAPGDIGELQVRGPYTIRGYFRAPDHNRKSFTEDGFYCPGDLIRVHPSGNLVVEGRTKDVINRGGEKIVVEDIESLILSHPSVSHAAVVAYPDAVLGERACACVVLAHGSTLTLAELAQFLKAEKRISPWRLPERLEVLDKLPLTGIGKVAKTVLRELVQRNVLAEGVAKHAKP
jgi:2,3-dihydroxybenzoate---[aryl-carrier protein] ligase